MSADDLQAIISPLAPADEGGDAPELNRGGESERAAWRQAVERVRAALGNDEFHLYYQEIRDLAAAARPLHDIFVRQAEEERNMMPPGAFFDLAEEFGLMAEFDRWVVRSLLDWAGICRRARPAWHPSIYCITLSRDTIGDLYFPDYVHETVSASRLPADMLCFELLEADALALPADARELVRNLRGFGCRTMVGGFARERIPMEILRDMHFDFLKFHPSLVLNILRDDATTARVRSVVRMAHTVGINTVAELVESPATLHKLRELEVDYAQGEVIAAAQRLRSPAQ